MPDPDFLSVVEALDDATDGFWDAEVPAEGFWALTGVVLGGSFRISFQYDAGN